MHPVPKHSGTTHHKSTYPLPHVSTEFYTHHTCTSQSNNTFEYVLINFTQQTIRESPRPHPRSLERRVLVPHIVNSVELPSLISARGSWARGAVDQYQEMHLGYKNQTERQGGMQRSLGTRTHKNVHTRALTHVHSHTCTHTRALARTHEGTPTNTLEHICTH